MINRSICPGGFVIRHTYLMKEVSRIENPIERCAKLNKVIATT